MHLGGINFKSVIFLPGIQLSTGETTGQEHGELSGNELYMSRGQNYRLLHLV